MTLALASERLGADLAIKQSVNNGECVAADFDGETIELCEFASEDARSAHLSGAGSSEPIAKLDWLMTISASKERTVDEVMSELTAGSEAC